jgi:hypothetical protein
MGKNIYNIQLNSNNKARGTFNNSLTYNFDWSVLPDNTAFKVSFAFIAAKNVLQGNTIANVECDIGQTNCYTTSSTSFGAQQNKILGQLYPYNVVANNSTYSYLYADRNNNPPIYIPIRPNNTSITVNIRDQTGTLYLDDGNIRAPVADYILTLIFEEI